MKRTKLIIIIIVVIIAVLIAFRLYNNKKQINEKSKVESTDKQLRIPVMVTTVDYFTPSSNLKKTGNITPFKQSVVLASTAGNILKINFDLGTKVSAGQLLAITDPQKINIDLQNAVAKERKLQNELNTYIELLAGKATTQEKVNQLRLDHTDAQNQVNLYKKQIADTRILAPISGIVTAKNVESGVYVNGGAEIATIVDLKKVKVQVYLTEAEAYQVKKNDMVKVTNEVFPDKIFSGQVTYVSPQGDATHSYLTEITVINPDSDLLKSGAFVYADFEKDNVLPLLSIPREALLENADKPSVYILNGEKVTLKEIKTGMDLGDRVEVISGLSKGEKVVLSGQINLKNGSLVKVTTPNTIKK